MPGSKTPKPISRYNSLNSSGNLRPIWLSRFSKSAMLTGVKCEEIADGGLVFTEKGGERRTIGADTIVLAAGSRPNAQLLEALNKRGYKTYVAGDCVKPRGISDAIYEGFKAGLAIE